MDLKQIILHEGKDDWFIAGAGLEQIVPKENVSITDDGIYITTEIYTLSLTEKGGKKKLFGLIPTSNFDPEIHISYKDQLPETRRYRKPANLPQYGELVQKYA